MPTSSDTSNSSNSSRSGGSGSAGPNTDLWERISRPGERHRRQLESLLLPDDYEGALKLDAFTDCTQAHKMHIIGASWLVTVPWSIIKRSTTPVFIGTVLAILPDTIYGQVKCQDKYAAFMQHVEARRQQLPGEDGSATHGAQAGPDRSYGRLKPGAGSSAG